jgi:MFS family permease
LPTALIQVAIMIGAIVGALSLPLIIEHIGWRMAYLSLTVCAWASLNLFAQPLKD